MATQYETTGYALSSWNYGSFHHCNPYYQKREYIKDRNEKQRPHSVTLNHLGKRSVPEEDKIVTEGYLQMMKDFKAIKNCENSSHKIKRNKSSTHIRGSIQSQDRNTNENYNQNTSQNLNMNTSQNSGTNTGSHHHRSIKSSKSFKYQLNFDEWAAVKSKQQEIYKKVKIIKESEDQNFEYFNKKVDENYKIIQEENFNEWLQKKSSTKQLINQKKIKIDEHKEMEKNRKQDENISKLDNWFKRQAELMDYQSRQKKKNEEKLKNDQKRKKKEEEARKARASEAFKIWTRKKEDDKNIEKRNNQNASTQEKDKLKRKNTFTRSKVTIGPYTGAGELKDIQKKITAYKNSEMYTENTQNEDEKQHYSKENIEDSLQELSSIKKESPVQEQDPDYY